jgi:hypothetical protein
MDAKGIYDVIDRLDAEQRNVLSGKGTYAMWGKQGMAFLQLGLVSMDPLADDGDHHARYKLTTDGIAAARRLRGLS